MKTKIIFLMSVFASILITGQVFAAATPKGEIPKSKPLQPLPSGIEFSPNGNTNQVRNSDVLPEGTEELGGGENTGSNTESEEQVQEKESLNSGSGSSGSKVTIFVFVAILLLLGYAGYKYLKPST